MSGHLTITELLLSAGADSSLVNDTGHTAVSAALVYHHEEVCQLLLTHTETKPHAPPDTTGEERPALTYQMGQLQLQKDIGPSHTLSSSSPDVRTALLTAIHHPLPPAGTSKHEVLDEENEDLVKQVSKHNY